MMRIAGLLLTLVALGACVPSSTPPRPVPAPEPIQRPAPPRPTPAPAPAPAPAPSTHWLDAPLSAGSWTYRAASSGVGSSAAFGPRTSPVLTIRCEPARRISLARSGAAGALTFRTSSAARTLNVAGAAGATLTADDPLLDALAFSRGRFAVETGGAAPLIVPAWPELARVVEDCRR